LRSPRRTARRSRHSKAGRWEADTAASRCSLREHLFPPPILTCVATLPSGLVTFQISDIEGSTRLLREREGGYAALLRSHRETVREEIVAHDGIEIDTQGDAFYVAFGRRSTVAPWLPTDVSTRRMRSPASSPSAPRLPR
jgi:class 3 adenylate cyclase